MKKFMSFQIGPLCKTFSTHRASKWPVAMETAMFPEGGGIAKLLSAFFTTVRFLSCVNSLVPPPILRPSKASITIPTEVSLIWLRFRVVPGNHCNPWIWKIRDTMLAKRLLQYRQKYLSSDLGSRSCSGLSLVTPGSEK